MAIDFVPTIHSAVKHMSAEKMAKFLHEELNACPYKDPAKKRCPLIGGCQSCLKAYLLQTDNSYSSWN